MASSMGTHPYTYPKSSAMATRSLVSDAKPSEIPSAASHDHDAAETRPVLCRKTTDNYEQAAAAAAQGGQVGGLSSISGPSPSSGGSGGAASDSDRPGILRQQSWSMSDKKRMHHEALLGQPTSPGYHSADRDQNPMEKV